MNRRDLVRFWRWMDADVEAQSRLAAMEGGYHGHDGIRHWWQNLLGAFPDYTVETVEARELGNLDARNAARSSAHGADSDTPFVETVWVVVDGVARRPSVAASCQTGSGSPRSRGAVGVGVASFARRFARPAERGV